MAIVVFIAFISDHRKMPSSLTLINRKIILLTKLCYLAPILMWIYAIVTASLLTVTDGLAFVISLSGIAITIKAKIDLGESHLWAGYYRADAVRVNHGFYRYLKHPMYSGIIAVIAAGSLFIWLRYPPWMVGITMVINLWIVIFLVVVAHRETLAFRKQW